MPEQQPRPESAQQKIDDLIEGLGDWRGERLAEVRGLIRGALPGVSETWKWMGSPVWEQDGIVVVGNAHKTKVKLTFPRGAQLTDPDDLFNAGLGASAWRAIDLHEQNTLDPDAFRALVRNAAALNTAPGRLAEARGRRPTRERHDTGGATVVACSVAPRRSCGRTRSPACPTSRKPFACGQHSRPGVMIKRTLIAESRTFTRAVP